MGYTLEKVKEKIKELIGHDVISDNYLNSETPLDIKCICGVIYQKSLKTIKAGYYHCNGKKQISKRLNVKKINCSNPSCNKIFKQDSIRRKFCSMICSAQTTQTKEYMLNNGLEKQSEVRQNNKLRTKICEFCKEEFQPSQSSVKFCSLVCIHTYKKTNSEYLAKAVLNGQKAGRKSAQSQQRRSKNEVCFAEMCEGYFGKDDVVCNEAMFDGWDADVIIRSRKMAVLWNGPWHYQQIMKTQSLKQVQARDAIKWGMIEKHGYTPFVIKDMGKHNPKFVKQEFECFLLSLISL